MINVVGILAFSLITYASTTFISGTDDLYARQTGIKNIQFVMGGDKEEITGEVDKDAIRRSFMANIKHHYQCYSRFYGGDSEKTGFSILRFDLDTSVPTYDPKAGNVAPSNLTIESIGLDDPRFINCIKNEWSKVKMMAPPNKGMVATVAMPIEGRRRPTTK